MDNRGTHCSGSRIEASVSEMKNPVRQKSDVASTRSVVRNRRALRDYDIIETYEAGIVLSGAEVKALRAGQGSLGDSYGVVRDGELRLHGAYIPQYGFSSDAAYDARRSRKLLMHRGEIDRLAGKSAEQGLTLVPLEIYFKDGLAKVKLALARGKRKYDKRAALREREHQREMARALKKRGRT